MNPVAMGVTPDKDEESQMGTRGDISKTDNSGKKELTGGRFDGYD